jgi:hypothetical protein
MPATTPKNTATEPRKVTEATSIRFVTCDLTPEQKAMLAAWVVELDTEDWVAWLTSTVTLGHIVSVRANEVGYQCAVTGGARDGAVHGGLCLVARASTPLKSLQAAMFKDQNVLAGVWPVTDRKSELDL